MERRTYINDLKSKLEEKYKTNSNAVGGATGKEFEKWIIEKANLDGEKGSVDFSFGKFRVDLAIPSKKEARILLEMKVNMDIQHALMLYGLLLFKPDLKVGLVTLYKPKPKTGKKKLTPMQPNENHQVINILNDLKSKKEGRFNYFFIEGSWSKALEDLQKWCHLEGKSSG